MHLAEQDKYNIKTFTTCAIYLKRDKEVKYVTSDETESVACIVPNKGFRSLQVLFAFCIPLLLPSKICLSSCVTLPRSWDILFPALAKACAHCNLYLH